MKIPSLIALVCVFLVGCASVGHDIDVNPLRKVAKGDGKARVAQFFSEAGVPGPGEIASPGSTFPPAAFRNDSTLTSAPTALALGMEPNEVRVIKGPPIRIFTRISPKEDL